MDEDFIVTCCLLFDINATEENIINVKNINKDIKKYTIEFNRNDDEWGSIESYSFVEYNSSYKMYLVGTRLYINVGDHLQQFHLLHRSIFEIFSLFGFNLK